jgi:hypothetical protein
MSTSQVYLTLQRKRGEKRLLPNPFSPYFSSLFPFHYVSSFFSLLLSLHVSSQKFLFAKSISFIALTRSWLKTLKKLSSGSHCGLREKRHFRRVQECHIVSTHLCLCFWIILEKEPSLATFELRSLLVAWPIIEWPWCSTSARWSLLRQSPLQRGRNTKCFRQTLYILITSTSILSCIYFYMNIFIFWRNSQNCILS